MPGFKLKFTLNNDLSLISSNSNPDTAIIIPLAAASYLIDNNQLKIIKYITIIGNQQLGQAWLQLMAQLKITNILYQHDSPLLGIIAVKFELLVTNLINYIKLGANNIAFSTSQYLQHENQNLVSHHELEIFYTEVDTLHARYELLKKRVERLSTWL